MRDFVTFSAGLLQVDGPGKVETEAYAGFGQIDYRFSDLIGVTLGGRYTKENKHYDGAQADINGFNYKLFNCTPPASQPLGPMGPNCQTLLGFPVAGVAAPTDSFTINGSVGYVDARYTYFCGEGGVIRGFCNANSAFVAPNPFQAGVKAGDALPKSPKWKFNIAPRFETPVGAGKVVFLADWTHTTKMRNDTEGTFLLVRKSTDMVNASVTYKAPEDRYSVTAGALNLTNERYLVTGQAQIAGGQIYGTYSRPVEWYVRLGFEF